MLSARRIFPNAYRPRDCRTSLNPEVRRTCRWKMGLSLAAYVVVPDSNTGRKMNNFALKIFTAHLEPAFARTETQILSCNVPGGRFRSVTTKTVGQFPIVNGAVQTSWCLLYLNEENTVISWRSLCETDRRLISILLI